MVVGGSSRELVVVFLFVGVAVGLTPGNSERRAGIVWNLFGDVPGS